MTKRSLESAAARNAFATESWRRTPPVTICTGLPAPRRWAGGSPARAGGGATIPASIDGCDTNASTLRCRIGRPPIDSSCLGSAPPNRWPLPPAAMIAVTCIVYMLSACELPPLDRGGDDGVHAVGELLGVARGGRLDRRRLNRIVHDQRDVGRTRLEPPLRHRFARADHRQRDDRQPGLDREQEAAALES